MVYVLLWILFVVGVSSTTPTQLIEIICGGHCCHDYMTIS